MPIQPNILILMVDQQRYDSCGCYGSQVCRTPNLDRLAGEGIRFTRAYTTVPLCSPTRATFWSGLRPNRNGILINTHWHDDHTNGNQAYLQAYPNVTFFSHQNTIDALKHEWQPMIDQRRENYDDYSVEEILALAQQAQEDEQVPREQEEPREC